MKTVLKKYAPAAALFLFLAALISFFLWLDRPLTLDPSQLSLSEDQAGRGYPGAELALDIMPGQLTMSLTNRGGATLFSGASVGSENRLIAGGGIEILLNGAWYQVPQERYASAGVGIELAPGESLQAEVFLNPARKLPDGQYRFSFGCQYGDASEETPIRELPQYRAYARFNVVKGRYVRPEQGEDTTQTQ